MTLHSEGVLVYVEYYSHRTLFVFLHIGRRATFSAYRTTEKLLLSKRFCSLALVFIKLLKSLYTKLQHGSLSAALRSSCKADHILRTYWNTSTCRHGSPLKHSLSYPNYTPCPLTTWLLPLKHVWIIFSVRRSHLLHYLLPWIICSGDWNNLPFNWIFPFYNWKLHLFH